MRRLATRIAFCATTIALTLSCAGGPKPLPAPLAKERILVVKVPVMVKESLLYPDGLLDEYSTFAYDETRQRLLSKSTFDPSRPDPIEKMVYEYDPKGVLLDELTYGADGNLKMRRETTWGSDKAQAGLLLGERWIDAKGQVQGSSSYEYDAKMRKTAWKTFDPRGALKATTLYSYDDQGRVVFKEIRNGANVVTGSISIAFSTDGTSEKDTYLGSDGAVQKIEVSLLKGGFVIHFENRRADDTLVEASDYTLGPLGERLSSVTKDATGKVKEQRSAEYAVREDKKVEIYYE